VTREEKYIFDNSSPISDALVWLERETNLRTSHARMLTGAVQGRFLELIACLLKPHKILEIGTFTGYSAICLAKGLDEGGILDALEKNDELATLIEEAIQRANLSDKIILHYGDALEIIPKLNSSYELVYIDANKREYTRYYDLIIEKVPSGGIILADNVLWDGKVYQENVPSDAQTQEILKFNQKVREDCRVENFILPLRDGINIIKKI
jgi:predicted O-methyltransferase YrrM